MRIAVLMTCHNRKETTVRCLQCLLPQLGSEDRVFLVDDGSTDGTGEAAKRMFECSNVRNGRVIQGDGNLFWAKGMALAWETAEREGPWDFYLWLNDDVALRKDALNTLHKDWKVCGDLRGVVVGVCAQDEAETASSYSATTSCDVQIEPNGVSPQQADGWFNGNCVLVPRCAYEQVGMVSNEYTHARADYDYAERLKRNGTPFFASSRIVGVCRKDFNEKVCNRPLGERIRMLWKPGYFNLHDLFLFRYRYYGLVRAIISCAHMIVIVLKGCP